MLLEGKFIQHVKEKQLFSAADQLIIAVSGGVDSVVLCSLCSKAGFTFSIAHCNFQLRAEESERDEQFVKEFAARYNVPLHLKKFDTETYAKQNKCSIQEAARDLRYGWFAELTVSASPGKPTFLLTAHHQDDNIETLLMNFFRGTGLHGLTAIPEKNGYIRRPLLPFGKEELFSYAKEEQLAFVEDSSNASSKYTRNYFRNELLPALQKVYPEVKENLAKNIQRFSEIESLYNTAVAVMLGKMTRKVNGEIHVPVLQLLKHRSTALVYELIRPYGFTEGQVQELISLGSSESGRYLLSPDNNYRIIKHRAWFIIAPAKQDEPTVIPVERDTQLIEFPAGRLQFKQLNGTVSNIPASPAIACIDVASAKFPLLLRKWKTGDYFYPLGMKKKKKLARFFIDSKLSTLQKENCWVLESGGKMIWIVGHRIDERFRITEHTKNSMQIEFLPAKLD
jgi:tRNA(Ile)-lysidine synthase